MVGTNYTILGELVDQGFSLSNLRASVRAVYDLARSSDVTNPAVPFVIGSVLDSVAIRWFEGQAVTDETATVLESRLTPPLRLLLATVNGPASPRELVDRLNAVVRAHGQCVAHLG